MYSCPEPTQRTARSAQLKPVDKVVKTAPTLTAAFIVTVHVLAAPEHAPVQLEKRWPAAGAAVNTTLVPDV